MGNVARGDALELIVLVGATEQSARWLRARTRGSHTGKSIGFHVDVACQPYIELGSI